MTGLTEEERRNLKESINRHKNALKRLAGDPHTCKMRYKGIRETLGNPVEIWECSICGRESVSPYTGTQDTIEWRE